MASHHASWWFHSMHHGGFTSCHAWGFHILWHDGFTWCGMMASHHAAWWLHSMHHEGFTSCFIIASHHASYGLKSHHTLLHFASRWGLIWIIDSKNLWQLSKTALIIILNHVASSPPSCCHFFSHVKLTLLVLCIANWPTGQPTRVWAVSRARLLLLLLVTFQWAGSEALDPLGQLSAMASAAASPGKHGEQAQQFWGWP